MQHAAFPRRADAPVTAFSEQDRSVGALLAALREMGAGAPMPDLGASRTSKRSLVVVAEAMKRSLASGLACDLLDSPGQPVALLIGLFQRRAYFEQEAVRYGALAAAGATVVVGCADGTPELPSLVHGLDLRGRPELARAFVLVTICGAFAAALVGVDDGGLVERGVTIEGSRTFVARWTFRRREAVDSARQLLAPLTSRLATRVLAEVESALRRADAAVISGAEDALATALEVIGGGLGEPRPARGLLGEPRDPLAEIDLLTGLHNRRFLEHHLKNRAGQSALELLALLVDVDDLGLLNAARGPEAGDAALLGVAAVLQGECRRGDLVVRSGDDEFLVLVALRGAGPLAEAERLCAAVRAMRLPRPFEQEHVTVSIGAVVADPTHLPYDRLADGLQLVKLLGKDAARLVE